MDELMSLEGPVLKVNGRLILMVPLRDNATESMNRSRDASEEEKPWLKIAIPDWLAGMLRIEEGDVVHVSNWDGELEIRPQAGLLN
jgi:hypothetical protein